MIRVYGLTGGVGSGKSEAARRFAAQGIPVLDADAVGHALLAPDQAAAQTVKAAFGDVIVTEGRVDRKKLGRLVFADPDAREKLNAILHPLIRGIIAQQIADLARRGHESVIVDAALLAEDGKRDECLDGLIVVTCSEQTRLRRLMDTRGWTVEQAVARIRAQTPPERKLALADWVIENEGTKDDLYAMVDEIVKEVEGNAR